MVDISEAEKAAAAGTATFMKYARDHWQEMVEELRNLRFQVATALSRDPFALGVPAFIPTVHGRIISSEIDPQSGMTVGKVECPSCQEEMSIGVIGSSPTCRCGLEWSLETSAVGTPKTT